MAISRVKTWADETLTASDLNGEFDNIITFLNTAASTTASGVVEIATAAEINTGTDAGRAVSPDTLAGSNFGIRYVQVECFGPTTDCATGDGARYFGLPVGYNGMNLVSIAGFCVTAGTTGTMDVQIHNLTDAVDTLSTKLTIDTGETHSSTAATPAVIDTANDDADTNDVWRVDVDAIHSGTAAKGLVVILGFQLP